MLIYKLLIKANHQQNKEETLSEDLFKIDTEAQKGALFAAIREIQLLMHMRGISAVPFTGDTAKCNTKMKFLGFAYPMPGWKMANMEVTVIHAIRDGTEVLLPVPSDLQRILVAVIE